MKTRLPADRLQEKSPTTLVANHLRQRYHFSPVVAEALTDDLQLLSHQIHGASLLAEGQILYPAVKSDEPAGKALKNCQYVMARLTMFAKSDIAFRQQHGLRELKKRILHRITEEADAQGGALTYEDLSWLLFADRKTIGQYIQELRARPLSPAPRTPMPVPASRITILSSSSSCSTTPRRRLPNASTTA